MCVAQRCPVCEGSGSVLASDPYRTGTTAPLYQTCHGCGGRGWVVVHCINEPTVVVSVNGVPVEKALPMVRMTDGLGYFQWPPQDCDP